MLDDEGLEREAGQPGDGDEEEGEGVCSSMSELLVLRYAVSQREALTDLLFTRKILLTFTSVSIIH